MSLKSDLQQERLSAYRRLRGGYPIPLAGALWWLGAAAVGYYKVPHQLWIFCAFVGSGLIFPMALGLGTIFRSNFMKDRTAVTGVLFPAFLSMLLFWPIAIAAWWTNAELVPLILGIGMSIHWPVIGWSYGRTGIYSAHAVVRAAACFYIWNWMPEDRFTLLPLTVAGIYLVTVLVVLIDSGRKR